jgi:putative transposase
VNAAVELAEDVGVVAACDALNVARATYYRQKQPKASVEETKTARTSHRALSEDERTEVLDTLNNERFADKAPYEVFATLLDEGRYLCSVRTMYRLLETKNQVRERRNQLRHPNYAKPELLATGPNQVWSWDITKLRGPEKWSYYYLYVIIDIYSRYVVGWMIAEKESATLAKKLIAETIGKEELTAEQREQLTLHADRGSSMKSKLVAQLLADLGVTKTHSRPHTSNDNPYSESQFKTLKYRPDFPGRFGSLEDGRSFCRTFFPWYNTRHHHHGIALLTPMQVHQGLADSILAKRQAALDAAFEANPHRFAKRPVVPKLRPEVWINPPDSSSSSEEGGVPGARGLSQAAERQAPANTAPCPVPEPAMPH